jgi:hypothetical protein
LVLVAGGNQFIIPITQRARTVEAGGAERRLVWHTQALQDEGIVRICARNDEEGSAVVEAGKLVPDRQNPAYT